MDERNRLIILYDCYKELLSESQKAYFEEYYFNNLSLKEIADNENLSRNAIHKQLKATEEKLEFYEENLRLVEKYSKILNEIKDEKLKEKITKILEG